mgnify:CR=1 FL=1
MTIRARVEYYLDENGDPVRVTPIEASSSCAAAETPACATPKATSEPATNQVVAALSDGRRLRREAAINAKNTKAQPVTHQSKGDRQAIRNIKALGLDGYKGVERSVPLCLDRSLPPTRPKPTAAAAAEAKAYEVGINNEFTNVMNTLKAAAAASNEDSEDIEYDYR